MREERGNRMSDVAIIALCLALWLLAVELFASLVERLDKAERKRDLLWLELLKTEADDDGK